MFVFRVLCCQTTSDLDAGARSPFQTAQNRLRQRGTGLYWLGTNRFTVALGESVSVSPVGIWQ